MPSSISNSETTAQTNQSLKSAVSDSNIIEYREIPDRSWTAILIAASVVMLASLIAWELLARSMHHIPGSYQSSFDTMWSEERSKLDQQTTPVKIVLVGSSRMLWNADLNILEKGLGARPVQLSLPGTGPALFVKDIVENTEFNGLLLVGVTPFLFNRLDEGFFGKAALDAYEYQSPSQWSGSKLHDSLSNYLGFLDDAFALSDLLERYTDLPLRAGAKKLLYEDWKLGNVYANRQTDMWKPVETVGSFDNVQITNFWKRGGQLEGDPMPLEKMQGMTSSSIEFFAPLVAKFQERGGNIIFILMPSSGLYEEFAEKSNYHEYTWKPMLEGFGAAGINTMAFPELSSDLDIPEWSHLSRESQDLWSARIISYIEEAK
ncbi:MAG: hypothetical protein ACI97K_002433 [Glaciecola sp.]|jgi:hypothetical protein